MTESIQETDKIIEQQRTSGSGRGHSYPDVQQMLNASSKAVYDTGDDGHESGFGLENQIGMQKRKGQHRGADGKFESSMKDVDDLDLEPGFGKSFDQGRGSKGGQKVKGQKISM